MLPAVVIPILIEALAPALTQVLSTLVPYVLQVLVDCIERGDDPKTLDWNAVAARSIAKLQAEVNAERREARC